MAKAVEKARTKAKGHKFLTNSTRVPIGAKLRELAPSNTLCQESSGVSTPYSEGLPCLRPAIFLIQHNGHDPMAMCEGCADHNVKNRQARYLPKGGSYVLWSPPVDVGTEKAEVVTDPAVPAQPTDLSRGEELVDYVNKGMGKFIPKLKADLAVICDVDRPASEFAQVYINLREVQDVINGLNKFVNEVEAKMAEFTIPQCFAREQIKSFTTDNGWRIGTSKKLYASILKEHRDAAFKWLRANGLPDLIQETVNAGTLATTAKDLLEHGRELPEELFTVAYKDNTSRTKVRVKK